MRPRRASLFQRGLAGLGLLGALALALVARAQPAAETPAPAPASGPADRLLAVYLPGVYFAQLERKLDLGNELANHLQHRLGDRYKLSVKVYSTDEALAADASRVLLALVESPFAATQLAAATPLSVALAGGGPETRLLVMGGPSVKSVFDLKNTSLAYASPLDNVTPFFDNFLFEGELQLGRDRQVPTKDVASALSLISLKKADAVLLYEDDSALGRQAGLQVVYPSAPLLRPTVILYDRKHNPAQVAQLREALAQFHGSVHPLVRGFRTIGEGPYQTLRGRIEKRPRRVPTLLPLIELPAPLPLPKPPAGANGQVPLRLYAPALD